MLVNADGIGAELYNLATDPNEMNNLATQELQIVQRMREAALVWRKSMP